MTEFPPPWHQPGGEAEAPPPVTDTVVSDAVDSRYCGSKRKQDPEARCRRPAGWGTDHVGEGRCKLHGGNTPSGKKFASKAAAVKARDTFGLPRDVDPHTALLEEVHRTAGHVAWLGAIVAQLRKGDLVWGTTKVKIGGDDFGTTQEAKLNAYLALYQDERKHLVKVSDVAIKAGVEERRVKVEEHRAAMLVEMLGAIFDNLELTPEQSAKLDELVPKALTGLAALEVTT